MQLHQLGASAYLQHGDGRRRPSLGAVAVAEGARPAGEQRCHHQSESRRAHSITPCRRARLLVSGGPRGASRGPQGARRRPTAGATGDARAKERACRRRPRGRARRDVNVQCCRRNTPFAIFTASPRSTGPVDNVWPAEHARSSVEVRSGRARSVVRQLAASSSPLRRQRRVGDRPPRPTVVRSPRALPTTTGRRSTGASAPTAVPSRASAVRRRHLPGRRAHTQIHRRTDGLTAAARSAGHRTASPPRGRGWAMGPAGGGGGRQLVVRSAVR